MSPTTSSAPDYTRILGDIGRAGVYHLPFALHDDPTPLVVAAEQLGYRTFRIDLGRARNKEDLLAAIGTAMQFPEWFGHNWDALTDCLADMEWQPAEGYLVLLEHCDALQDSAGEDLVLALQIFNAAANESRQRDIALWCFVDMHADGIAWLPGLQ